MAKTDERKGETMRIGKGIQRLKELGDKLHFHLITIWLFTFSDLKTIVGPTIFFGVFNAICASAFGMAPESHSSIMCRFPYALLWVWTNLLPFAVDNQGSP